MNLELTVDGGRCGMRIDVATVMTSHWLTVLWVPVFTGTTVL